MFGDAVAMTTFVGDSQASMKEFCFEMFLASPSQHGATSRQVDKKASLSSAALPSRRLLKNLRSHHDLNLRDLQHYQSPLQRLQDELQTQVSSGAISSTDQSALSSALNDIDSSLQGGQSSGQSGGTQSSPGDLKSKIDDLIAGEVSSGKLTSDQATELQGVFKAAFANGPDGAGGPGGAGGAHHGHHGGPPPTDSSSSSDSTSNSSGTSSASDILQQFLQSLQDSLSASSSTPYSATGTSGTGSNSSTSFSALLIDYQT
jgi:hypothetical protein